MFVQNRQSREINLDMPGSYQRLRASARDNRIRSGYWHGKVVYYLIGSAVKNFVNKRIFTAASRTSHIPLSLWAAGKYLLLADFWIGATKPHSPRVWLAIQDTGKNLYQNTRWNDNF
jgi:hypothetical protein